MPARDFWSRTPAALLIDPRVGEWNMLAGAVAFGCDLDHHAGDVEGGHGAQGNRQRVVDQETPVPLAERLAASRRFWVKRLDLLQQLRIARWLIVRCVRHGHNERRVEKCRRLERVEPE